MLHSHFHVAIIHFKLKFTACTVESAKTKSFYYFQQQLQRKKEPEKECGRCFARTYTTSPPPVKAICIRHLIRFIYYALRVFVLLVLGGLRHCGSISAENVLIKRTMKIRCPRRERIVTTALPSIST